MAAFYRQVIASVLLLIATAEAAKILAIFPFPAKSHVGAFQSLMEELAQRGHEVTVVTAFPRGKPLANYNEIIFEDTLPPRDSGIINMFELKMSNPFFMFLFMGKMLIDSCENFIKQPIIQGLLHNTELKYDLIIYEPYCAECSYGLLHKFKAPTIQMFPNTLVSMMADTMGNPSTVSSIPDAMSETDTLNFQTRLFNVVRLILARILTEYVYQPQMDSIMRKYFPDASDLPSTNVLASNSSFLFLHSHPVVNYPRPFSPNTIDVAAIHIRDKQSLPQDLQKYLDEAPHGVIYFSMGSNVRSVDMPEKMRDAILKSFSKIKQRVLWKWEADNLPGQPGNVRLGKWLPQHAILAHPKVKLFITHGGLMSIEEATYFGVPLVAIPVMGDQKFNALHVQNKGYGLVLEINNITEESLDWTIHETIHEPRYRETAQRLSRIFRDQPQTPMERAVYWVEYAIRHKGAPHMRSAALDLNFFQYYLLDVIAVLLLVGIAVISVFVLLCKMTFRQLFSKSKTIKTTSKGKKNN